MNDTIRWLIGIVLAMAGIGLGMFYQGKVLLKPDEKQKIGKQLYILGKIWIAIAVFYLVVVVGLQLLF